MGAQSGATSESATQIHAQGRRVTPVHRVVASVSIATAPDPSKTSRLQKLEAVMDDSRDVEARTPQTRRYVSELELLEALNRSLWEIERQRVEERTEAGKR